MCMTFFELMSVAYLSFLKYALIKDEEVLFTLHDDTDSSCVIFQDIVRDVKNSKLVWLGNDWSLDAIKKNENQSDIT